MFKDKIRLFLGIFLITCISIQAEVVVIDHGSEMAIQTEYGDYIVDDSIILDLIRSPAFQRLKHIHQYGVCRFAREETPFTRYDHSLGVFVLLRRFGAGLDEQIDGLLHDVSHTVFSHVGDFVFNHYFDSYSYQDDMHEWFLQKMGVDTILKQHGFESACAGHMKKKHKMLEQDKPDLCMDRIEYLLRGGLVDNLLRQEQVASILDDLYFENQLWIFKHADKARQLADVSLWLTEHIFSSAWNSFIYTQASNALLHAVEKKLITLDDIHFSTDDVVWNTLQQQGDVFIEESLDKIRHYKHYFAITDERNYDVHFKEKFLGVNPWVETESGLQRLTEIDASYAAEYNRISQLAQRGWFVKLHDSMQKEL